MSDSKAVGSERNLRIEAYQDEVYRAAKRKFEAGREKYGDSWTKTGPEYLYRRMEEEFYEFRQAVEHDRDEDAALEEVADIVNFGLMYLAQHRQLNAGDEQ